MIAAPVLALFGALDQIEWHVDFVTGVETTIAIIAAIAIGFVMARWRALVVVWLLAVAWVAIEQLRWDDDPTLAGLDDLSPSFLFPFTPLVCVLPAIGDGLARLVRSNR